MRAPEFSFSCFVSQRLKRNGNFDYVSTLVNEPLRLHNNIDTEIFAASFSQDPVGLDTEGIEKELEGLSLVIKRIQEHAHIVIVENIVALRHSGAHLVHLIKGAKGDVEE